MKKQYFKSLPKNKELKNMAYQSHLALLNDKFQDIKKEYTRDKCVDLFNHIKNTKAIKEIKKTHKEPIFKYFFDRELKSLDSIKNGYTTDFKIMKATKCKVEGLTVDWKSLWKRIIQQCPEVSYNSTAVDQLVKSLKIFYDENNAIDVWNYFKIHHPTLGNRIYTLFTRITHNTRQQTFIQYIKILMRQCELQKMKPAEFIYIFLNASRTRKQLSLPSQIYSFVNNVMLELMMTTKQTANKKYTIESRFNSSAAAILEHIIGKANPGSIELLDTIFYFLKRFVKPLQNSSKAVSFIYNLMKGIFFRVEKENNTRDRLKKLLQKTKGKEKQKQEEEDDEEDEDDQMKQDEENQLQLDDPLEDNLILNEDDENQLKPDNDQEKKERMEKILVNQIHQPILHCLQAHITEMFESIYYVNSKKAISHLLRYLYRVFPKMAIKSLDVLDRAANIPNINEEGLVKNMIVGVQHMFVESTYRQGVKNVMRVLERAYNCRRIIDVWQIYEAINSKIPLLDEKDLEKIPDADKEAFEASFQMNHDRFYEEYSEHFVQAFKRLLREGQFIQKSDEKKYSTTMAQIHCNSYPFMKKRLLAQTLQVVADKPNSFALFYLVFAQIPDKQAQILTTQMKSMNFQNKSIEQLRLAMLGILAKKFSLKQFKPYIREMASQNYFRLIQDYSLYRIVEDIQWEPWATSLKYLEENPKLSIQFDISAENVKKSMKQLEEYRDQLLEEVAKETKNITDLEDNMVDRIVGSYTNSEKIKVHQARKNIYQALTIAALINQSLQPKILTIQNKKLEILESGVKPYGFLQNKQPYASTIKILLKSQQTLGDSKLIRTITNLLTNEFFMCEDTQNTEKKKAFKERRKNKNHQAPDYANRILYGNQYISLSRVYMSTICHNEIFENLSFQEIKQELFVLIMINSNEQIKDLLNMFIRKKMSDYLKQKTIQVVHKKVENRFLIKRISDVLEYMSKHEVPFTNEQILDIIDYHAFLVQSKDAKIREHGIKSFKKIIKILNHHPLNDDLLEMISKYLKVEKMEMIWIIFVIVVINHPEQKQNPQKAQERILKFLKQFQTLLLHETRSIRRTALYVSSLLMRKLKKIHTQLEEVKFGEENKLPTKSLEDFMETGFLHPCNYNSDLKDKSNHIAHPFQTYQKKKKYNFPDHICKFLIDDPQKAMNFIKNFHSDMAATSQMLISSIQNSMLTIDLFSVATKALQNVFFLIKTKQMNISKSEVLVGGRFFKYLCLQDARNDYKFFKTVKQFVIEALGNMQSLDNQTLVLLYSSSLLNAYEKNYTERIPDIEQFLQKIINEIIGKSSGSIFKKFQTVFFHKIRNTVALKFIEEICEKNITKLRKISRAGEIQIILHQRSYQKYEQIFKIMLSNRIELEKSYISNSMFNLLMYPQQNTWIQQEITKTGVLDLKSLIEQKRIKTLPGGFIVLNNQDFHKYLVQQLAAMIESQEIEIQKAGFSLVVNAIRCCRQMYISEENSDLGCELLKLGFKIVNTKNQLQLDYDTFYKSLRELFGARKLPTHIFEKYLLTIINCVDSKKRSSEILNQILASPCNYLSLSKEIVLKFTEKVLELEQNSALYKQYLQVLSTIYSYNKISLDIIQNIEAPKNKKTLLLQAYLLANYMNLDLVTVKQAFKISTKQRKNIWAREMMLVRGQREYFENQETHEQWRVIKSLSNPYHYHA